MKSYSPARWLTPPPSATARFSSRRSPGVVLRVSRILAVPPASATARTTRAVAVATPERRPRKFRAVRSPVSSARAEPSMRSTGAPASRHSPSGPSRSTFASGSRRRKTAAATSSPEITPGAFWVIVARARAEASTVASVVASPSPTSSASARSIRSSMAGSMPGAWHGCLRREVSRARSRPPPRASRRGPRRCSGGSASPARAPRSSPGPGLASSMKLPVPRSASRFGVRPSARIVFCSPLVGRCPATM